MKKMPEVKLKTEKYDILKTAAMKLGKTVVDDSLIVPDTKPDVKKVLDVSARSYLTDITPGQDKVHIEGVVRATVLYLPDGGNSGKIKSLEMNREFSTAIDQRGVNSDSKVSAEAEIESQDSTVINSRKVNVRVVVSIGVKVCQMEELTLMTDIESDELPAVSAELQPFAPRTAAPDIQSSTENIQLKKTSLRLADKHFMTDGSILVRGQHEISSKLPQIGEILRTIALVEPEEVYCSAGCMNLKGGVKITVMYSDSSEADGTGAIRTAEFTLPYDEKFESGEILEDMECDAEYVVREIYAEVMDNMDGEARTIGAEVVVGTALSGYMVSEAGVMTDAYDAGGSRLNAEFQETSPEQILGVFTAQISRKCTASRRQSDSDINGVCGVTVEKTAVDDVRVNGSSVFIKGAVTLKVLCSSSNENQPLYPIETQAPFEHNFDIGEEAEGKIDCDVKLFVNHIGYTISGSDSVDIRLIIGTSVKLVKSGRVKMIVSMEMEDEEKSDNGMREYIIYFVQPGDTLWKIAKRYKTTVDEIVKNNDIKNPDEINAGQKIKIL